MKQTGSFVQQDDPECSRRITVQLFRLLLHSGLDKYHNCLLLGKTGQDGGGGGGGGGVIWYRLMDSAACHPCTVLLQTLQIWFEWCRFKGYWNTLQF